MDSEKSSVTLKIGWILLLLAGLLMTLGGLESFAVAYWGADDLIAGVSLEKLAQVNPDLPKAMRGRRATAAFYATSCGLLVAWVAVAAYPWNFCPVLVQEKDGRGFALEIGPGRTLAALLRAHPAHRSSQPVISSLQSR